MVFNGRLKKREMRLKEIYKGGTGRYLSRLNPPSNPYKFDGGFRK
jgi:hypothetical protein